MNVPTAYAEGYRTARPTDPEAVDNYVKHTGIGDPELDPIMEELSSMPPGELHRFIGAGIEGHDDVLKTAPEPLRNFFNNLEEPPWLDYEALRPGIRAFHGNVDLMLAAFVTGVLVEGFSTLIAKSFNITGRVASTKRRLQQNNRHMMDIFFPGGLGRDGDGWKLSARIRFVHTRIRSLLNKSEEWDHDAWGTPVSAAHLGFAISVFSQRLIEYSLLLGAKFNEEEQRSVLQVWRYAGYVMGIPETILYTSVEDAKRVYKISYMCEPEADIDSITVANMLIKAIPSVADVQDPQEQQQLVGLAYRLSRALIGERLATAFDFPKRSFWERGTLLQYRSKQRFLRTLAGIQRVRAHNFTQLLQISVYDDEGLSYKMPDHVHTSKSISW
ncbi:oxygenase MpaB family protein [Candidatus Palauibacter sp.]|uniref:oxygenase MpaB family protein n=1 Tax=Candidatus Palauibacter sp. TaxID=3101350 RepID=UPI003B5AEEE7